MRTPIRLVILLALAVTASPSAANSPTATGLIDRSVEPSPLNIDFELADGAAWDGRSMLYIPDVKAKKLLVLNTSQPEQTPRTRLKDIGISGTCFQNGKLFFTDNPGSRVLSIRKTGPPTVLATFDADDRPNDLTVDAIGNVYVTFTKRGLVRRIAPAGQATVLVEGLVTPNGIAISPDGSTLYVSSAKTGLVSQIELKQKNFVAKPFAQLAETENGFRGDGMAVDRAGNVYCTGATSLTVWDASGTQIDKLEMPVRPINVILGGTDGRDLFLSTFDGVYQTRVRAYGVSPNPDPRDTASGITSTKIPSSIKASINQVYGTDGSRNLLLDLFEPKSPSAARPAIVLVHGGGWLKGDKTKFRPLALRLAERGYVVAAIEYRLGYEKHFPAAIADCNQATTYMRKHAEELSIDPDRISAVGGSAGGHLVGLMASGSNDPGLRSTDSDSEVSCELAAAVVMAGPLQTATGSVAERSIDNPQKSNAFHWLGGTIIDVEPQYQLADAFEKIDKATPPMLFISGSKDNPQRNQASRDRLSQLGIKNELVVHQGATHGHWNRADWMEQVVEDIDVFLKSLD